MNSCLFQSVLRLFVPPQVHFPLETFPAKVTAEGLEARVFPAVCDEVGALTEGLPAHLALVRLLTCKQEQKKWKMLGLPFSFLHVFITLTC